MSKVLTVGTFDMPHIGHLELFKKCRKIADLVPQIEYRKYEGTWGPMNGHYGEVVVGVNTDAFVLSFKKKLPIYSDQIRVALLSNLKDIDRVILNNEFTLQNMLEKESPDFLIVGSDWAKKDYYSQIGVTREWLDQHNITLLYVEYTSGISSTDLRGRLSGESS